MKRMHLSLLLVAVIALIIIPACGVVSSLPKMAENLISLPAATEAPATPAPVTAGPTAAAPQPLVQPGMLEALQGNLEEIYSAVSPSVVHIRVVQRQTGREIETPESPGFPFFFESPDGQNPQEFFSQGQGSGFVWDQEGHIVTNNHVVEGASKIEVTFSDGSIVPAESVGNDPYSDLAVVKVDLPASQLLPVQLADSNQVRVGQLAIAIGNPFGLQGTMTVGIVSGVGRSLPVEQLATSTGRYIIPDIIQTDAPINPGNSGGVLLNDKGLVIGVPAAIQSTVRANAGIAYAIPAAIVGKVIPVLIESGVYQHPWIGFSGTPLTPDLVEAMGLDAGQRGALVNEIISGSPAEKAGLRGSSRIIEIDGLNASVGGDVIIAIDGEAVTSMNDVIAYLARHTSVGQEITLTVLRDGRERTLNVTLAARPGG